MSLKKFGTSDVIRNAMRAYPQSSFFIYSGSVYYNKQPIESGSFSADVLGATGGLSLFEYNIDKAGTTALDKTQTPTFVGLNPPIIPYTAGSGRETSYIKASPRSRTLAEGPHLSFQITASGPIQDVSDAIVIGDNIFTGSSYVMSSSIVRELMLTAGSTGSITNVSRPVYPHYYGLRNSLNFYGTRSPHYSVNHSSSVIGEWNKDEQDINLIAVPKIFDGTSTSQDR